ncbi:hypothetical protein AAEX28_13370 [Lentisphaerota bacterium WC36G]
MNKKQILRTILLIALASTIITFVTIYAQKILIPPNITIQK